MNHTKINTRDVILDLLKKEVSLAVTELTDRLNITHMAVRKHLGILEKEGLVKSDVIRQSKGRPLQVYSLTNKGDRTFPQNYEGMTVEFLKDIEGIHGIESVELLFERREERLISEYNERLGQKSIADKIKEIATIQDEKGYMTKFEQLDDHSFELVEYNCPIFSVASEYKIACKCETNMFKQVLGIDQIQRVSCKTEGNDHCRFLFQTNTDIKRS